MHHQKGFTLIELMVAIAIIAILFGVMFTSFNAVRKSARDTQRQSDLRNIQSALQQYYADQNYYPDTPNLTTAANLTNCTGLPSSCTTSKIYLKEFPKDPSDSTNYRFKPFPNATTDTTQSCSSSDPNLKKCHYFILCAKLEGTSTNQSSECQTTFGVDYNYQLTPTN